MIIDARVDNLDKIRQQDVIIVGAGLSGLFLAQTLVEKGLSVTVIESGDAHQSTETHFLNKVEHSMETYSGATHGRFRCLGGTSTRWGGALLPFLQVDFEQHSCSWHDGWGLSEDFVSNKLEQYLHRLECSFGLDHDDYHGSDKYESWMPTFIPRKPKWPKFKYRSAANIFWKNIRDNQKLNIVLNATVKEIICSDTDEKMLSAKGVALSISPHSEDRNTNISTLKLTANRIALCAGALENTRLLLLIDDFREKRGLDKIINTNGILGENFHDHISACIAKISPKNYGKFLRDFTFSFCRGGMRNLRFELSPDYRKAQKMPAAFIHISFTRSGESGFDGLREIFQSFQRASIPKMKYFLMIAKDLPWFFEAILWRFWWRKVFPPYNCEINLNLVMEQNPNNLNKLSLSEVDKDVFGLPLLKVDWHVSDLDKSDFIRIASLVNDEWQNGYLGTVTTIEPFSKPSIEQQLDAASGIYHPAGTCRMGNDIENSVVDTNLKVHGITGLWAISTASFPNVGGTSPSLGMLQFTLHAAENIYSSKR